MVKWVGIVPNPHLGRVLLKIVRNSNNQVLIITHSPYFVDYAMVSSNKSAGLVYVKKEDGASRIFYKPDDFQVELTSHLFRPEIFFSKCNMLVEGADELAAFAAISEGYGNVLDLNDIALVDTWGTENIEKYIPLLEVYKIPYVAMADHDYNGPVNNDVVLLEGILEDELRKLGWDKEKKYKKAKPLTAYKFLSELTKTAEGRQKIKTSIFFSVLKAALDKIDPKIFESL